MAKSKKKHVLILGAAGMLGHKLYQVYKNLFTVRATVRSSYVNYAKYGIFDPNDIIDSVDVNNFDKIVDIVARVRPDVVVNCIGIIKQLKAAKDPIASIQINSLLPHRLASLCQASNSRFLHISTDCVFNGKKGSYTEEDISDATDLYGRTKFLGETDRQGCLTLRTSIIGRELSTARGLIEWFLSNRKGKVKGFKKAIYTGFMTLTLAEIIADIIKNQPDLSGIYQVSSAPIDKYSLLCLVRDAFGIQIEIEPENKTVIDSSLNSRRFRSETGFKPPSWPEMIKQMAQDPTPYDKFRAF